MDRIRTAVQGALALIAGYWHLIPPLTQTLAWLMLADIMLGLFVAVRKRQLSAAMAYTGATKKIGILVLIGVCALLNPHVQPVLGVDLIQVASAFYLAYELSSIIRNAAILEVPIFTQMQDVLKYFQQGQERKGDKD